MATHAYPAFYTQFRADILKPPPESVLRSVYLPARINGQPISTSVSMMYIFRVPGESIGDYQGLGQKVHDTELKAQGG